MVGCGSQQETDLDLIFIDQMEGVMGMQTLNNDRKLKWKIGNVTTVVLRDSCCHDILFLKFIFNVIFEREAWASGGGAKRGRQRI